MNSLKKQIWPGKQPKLIWKEVYSQVSEGKSTLKAASMHRLLLYPWYLGAVQEYETRLKLLEEGLGDHKEYKFNNKGLPLGARRKVGYRFI